MLRGSNSCRLSTLAEEIRDDFPLPASYRVGHLKAAKTGVVSVALDAPIAVAVTKMIACDFSQLAVMNGPNNVKGVISWRTIARTMLLSEGVTKVRECIERPHEVSEDEPLVNAIPIIAEHDYVLVKASNGPVCGIVTAADLSLELRKLTEPFLLLGQIERHLRKLLDGKVLAGDVATAAGSRRRPAMINDLTLGECIRAMDNPQIWDQLELRNIDRAEFMNPLILINGIRNRVMHFRADELTDGEMALLRRFSEMVKMVDEMRSKNV
jgi:predicted transcriptional regulator